MSTAAPTQGEVHDDEKRRSSSSSSSSHHAPIVVDTNQAGVARIEALYHSFGSGKGLLPLWVLWISLALIAFIFSLDESTTTNILPFALSSLSTHSSLGTIGVLNNIIYAVGRPFIAKIADITSRPRAYVFSLFFYELGYIIVASSRSLPAISVGQVLYTIGKTGLDLVTDIIVADISPLKWRGLATALPASPYIINAFISAEVINRFATTNWRWGYGIFLILLPAVMAPGLTVLFWAELKAKREHIVTVASSAWEKRNAGSSEKPSRWRTLIDLIAHIDGPGLILLGFAFALLLVPLTIYHSAKGEFSNPSLIAMFVIGALCLIAFVVWEAMFTEHPLMPRRVLNRTFIGAVVIDVTYMLSGNMRSLYYSSWVYVVKNWSLRDWTYFTQTLTVGLCVFGLLAGVIQRATHRYKYLQVSGLCIRIIGMGLTLHARGPAATDAELVWTQILIALGGAFSVVGSRVASQASVPHADMAQVIALLSLWTSLGGAIGNAIAAAVWTGTMPNKLRQHLPSLPEKNVTALFGNIKTARLSKPDVRAGVIDAYNETVFLLYLPALILSFIPLLAALFMQNFYLGDTQNAVEGKNLAGEAVDVPGDPTVPAQREEGGEVREKEREREGEERV